MRRIAILGLALGLGLTLAALQPGTASAGSSQAGDPVLPMTEIAALSDQVERALAERGAHVALVARVGQDPDDLPPGIRFTHAAFWVYSNITTVDGQTSNRQTRRGYRAFNLYQRADQPGRSDLIQDNPADFFTGSVTLSAGVVIPEPRLQQKLLTVLTGPAHARLHNPSYSMVSNPDNNLYQNCTEHVLNTIFAALYGSDDMARIKANIATHFAPQAIQVSPLRRALGPVFVGGLETADHGETIRTATFSTVAGFLDRNALSSEAFAVTPSGVVPLTH